MYKDYFNPNLSLLSQQRIYEVLNLVAPVRERGLKFIMWYTTIKASWSLP